MQLSFLGRTYTRNSPVVELTETEEIVNFLGQPAQVKQLTAAQRQHPPVELKFLGRRYTR